MRLASVEVERAVEGTVGVLLLAVVLSVLAIALIRRRVARGRAQRVDPGVPALARFADIETHHTIAFGGGAGAARVQRRQDTVTYGYLAMAEEYVGVPAGEAWCTLTVALPGRVPFLVVDAVPAAGRVGVPLEAPHRERVGAAAFDDAYVVGVAEPGTAGRILTPGAQSVLLTEPVQRLMLHDPDPAAAHLRRRPAGPAADRRAARNGRPVPGIHSVVRPVVPGRVRAGAGRGPAARGTLRTRRGIASPGTLVVQPRG